MTVETALWIGIAAGAILGTAATLILLAIGVAMGRHLAQIRRTTTVAAVEPPTDTFDHNLRDLIKTYKGRS